MIIQLTGDDISKHWDEILNASLEVNPLIVDKLINPFARNLIKHLMSNDYQCWGAKERVEDKKLKSVAITRIIKDIGELPYLLIDVAYGYKPTTDMEKQEFFKKLVEFAHNKNCSHIIAYTANQMAANIMQRVGMKETARLYSMEVLNGRQK